MEIKQKVLPPRMPDFIIISDNPMTKYKGLGFEEVNKIPVGKLTKEQADVLRAFFTCFDLYATTSWASVEAGMIKDFGISDPEAALEDVEQALS